MSKKHQTEAEEVKEEKTEAAPEEAGTEAAPEAETAAEPEKAEAKPADEKPRDDALAAMNDKYLRLCAEYDNFRKRSQKEKDALYDDIKANTLKSFLPVYDNLVRALN